VSIELCSKCNEACIVHVAPMGNKVDNYTQIIGNVFFPFLFVFFLFFYIISHCCSCCVAVTQSRRSQSARPNRRLSHAPRPTERESRIKKL